jgi:DNA-binding transcriptional ArsR family regulator
MRRDVFQAIADPTRRAIIHLLASKPMTLNSIAAQFPISRPAISKHIKILVECDVLHIRQQGRERICTSKLDKLQPVQDWLTQYEIFWNHELDALAQHLEASSENNDKESPA